MRTDALRIGMENYFKENSRRIQLKCLLKLRQWYVRHNYILFEQTLNCINKSYRLRKCEEYLSRLLIKGINSI